jgi:hypothetical protein
MEVIDLGLNDLEPVSISFNDSMGGSSGGGPSLGLGLELLMNDKKKTASNSMNVDLGELDKLEDELNNLSSSSSNPDTKSIGGMGGFGNFFGFNNIGSITLHV